MDTPKTMVVKVFIDGKPISQRTFEMTGSGYTIVDELLGLEISKNALHPTPLTISIEWELYTPETEDRLSPSK